MVDVTAAAAFHGENAAHDGLRTPDIAKARYRSDRR
jgi:hypothetical protein